MNLKRSHILFLVCCAAAGLGGCSDRQESPAPQDKIPVRFGVSSLESRSNAVLTADAIHSMGVFGYSTGTSNFNPSVSTFTPNLIYNQEASREIVANVPGEWEYTPPAYWPLDLSVKNSFFAYSPHSSHFAESANVIVSGRTASGYPTLTYTLPTDITEQEDILYAAPVLDINRESNGGKVLYEMKHALSWLAFVVTPTMFNDPNEEYTVNRLIFMADELPMTATLNLGTGQWSNVRSEEKVVFEFELDETEATNIKPGEVARIVDPASRLMLFPITIDSELSGATVDLTFMFNGEEYYYYVPFPTTYMTAGNVVVYLINISIDGIIVEFMEKNKIEDWLPGGGKQIDIF